MMKHNVHMSRWCIYNVHLICSLASYRVETSVRDRSDSNARLSFFFVGPKDLSTLDNHDYYEVNEHDTYAMAVHLENSTRLNIPQK